MAKILEFKRRVKQEPVVVERAPVEPDGLEEEILAIVNDYSLTPHNRRWLLENMLMEIDEQLEEYKKELEQAEQKLDKVVKAAEREITTAYGEFETHVNHMTKAVKKLTRRRRSMSGEPAEIAIELPDQR